MSKSQMAGSMPEKLQHLKGKTQTVLNAAVMEIKTGADRTHTQTEPKTAVNRRIYVQQPKGAA
jgi:hypothetical protein